MAEHDPANVEYMARLLCVARGIDPDKDAAHGTGYWTLLWNDAIRALDHMAARGEKVTTREPTAVFNETWAAIHDAAPMTPRDN